MEREQLLETLKILILALKHQAIDMEQDSELIKRWQEKAEQFKVAVQELSEEDKEWFEKEYKVWLENRFSDEIQKIMLQFG